MSMFKKLIAAAAVAAASTSVNAAIETTELYGSLTGTSTADPGAVIESLVTSAVLNYDTAGGFAISTLVVEYQSYDVAAVNNDETDPLVLVTYRAVYSGALGKTGPKDYIVNFGQGATTQLIACEDADDQGGCSAPYDSNGSPTTWDSQVGGAASPIGGTSITWNNGFTFNVEGDIALGGGFEVVLVDDLSAFNYGILTTTLALGDVPSPVPVPAAAWLFGSALIGLAGIGRKRSVK